MTLPDNKNKPLNKDIPTTSSLDQIKNTFVLTKVLLAENINPLQISIPMESAGFNLNLSESQRQTLAENQFRGYESGRGIAMSHVLGERRQEFDELVEKACANSKWSIKGDKTRGACQFSADLVSLAAGVMTCDEFCEKTNRRIAKGQNHKIKDKIASLPTEAAIAVIDFFTSTSK